MFYNLFLIFCSTLAISAAVKYEYDITETLQVGDKISVIGEIGNSTRGNMNIMLMDNCKTGNCSVYCIFDVRQSTGDQLPPKTVIKAGAAGNSVAFDKKQQITTWSNPKDGWQFQTGSQYKLDFELVALHKLLIKLNDIPYAVFVYVDSGDFSNVHKIAIIGDTILKSMLYDYVQRN